jgi:hypothetical protein
MWNKLQQVAGKRSTSNNPAPYQPPPAADAAQAPVYQWILGGAGLILILVALIAVPLIIAATPADVHASLGNLAAYLIAGGLTLLGVAIGTLRWARGGGTPRHRGDGGAELDPTPIYRPGTAP